MAHVAERVVVSVAIVLAAMALYNAAATWREDQLYSPPGSPSPLNPLCSACHPIHPILMMVVVITMISSRMSWPSRP